MSCGKKYCLGFIPIRCGSVLIAVICFMQGVGLLVMFYKIHESSYTNPLRISFLIYGVILAAFSVLLLIGVIRKLQSLITPWIWFTTFMLIVFILLETINVQEVWISDPDVAKPTLAFMILHCLYSTYFIYVVANYRCSLKHEEKAAKEELQPLKERK